MRSGRVHILKGNQWETLWLINQELIGIGSSNLEARLVTWPAMHTWFRACTETHTSFNTGRALFSQITLITYIVEPPKLSCTVNRQIGVGDSKNVILFDPLLTSHVIWRMRTGRVRILNGNQRETLWLINQELIAVGSSNLVARLFTWPIMHSNCSRSKGQKSRSQGHTQEIYAFKGFSKGDARE